MLSGIGHAQHLRDHGIEVIADLPVGDNLHDHMFHALTFHATSSTMRGNASFFAKGVLQEAFRRPTPSCVSDAATSSSMADGWLGLAKAYGLSVRPVGMEHALTYPAIHEGKLDVTDAYSTDGDLRKFDLVLLEDDRRFFPPYLAMPLVQSGLNDSAKRVLEELAGTMTAVEMQTLNQSVQEKKSLRDVATQFLRSKGLLTGERPPSQPEVAAERTDRLALSPELHPDAPQTDCLRALAGMAVAIPLGALVYRLGALSRPLLYVAGILQTIPSIALLAFMIPVFGIGAKPAIAALSLYSLLPILNNTATALLSIDPVLRKVSVGMGLDGLAETPLHRAAPGSARPSWSASRPRQSSTSAPPRSPPSSAPAAWASPSSPAWPSTTPASSSKAPCPPPSSPSSPNWPSSCCNGSWYRGTCCRNRRSEPTRWRYFAGVYQIGEV